MNDLLKMVGVLSILCALSGFALAGLKTLTAPIIEEQVLTFVQGPALQGIFSQSENSPIADRKVFEHENNKITVFPCMQNGKLTAIAIEEQGKGYGGNIGVMVGFNITNDSLAGVGITLLKETPGLGMRVTEANFREQFVNKTLPVALTANGGAIDGISGATISSTGVVSAINKASDTYKAIKPAVQSAWQ